MARELREELVQLLNRLPPLGESEDEVTIVFRRVRNEWDEPAVEYPAQPGKERSA